MKVTAQITLHSCLLGAAAADCVLHIPLLITHLTTAQPYLAEQILLAFGQDMHAVQQRKRSIRCTEPK
jgi:hypothetical protein